MTDDWCEDERWLELPLDCDFDADDAAAAGPQLPPGVHVVVVKKVIGRKRVAVARLAVDLPDIAEWNG
ncbi:hypothetical protein [Kitasatospora sp. NBC_01302]|uniref:hypothetical protein n=1 Tax=Kitasatospora sp. NBC_01302 TaxID=2903575 RepID=UPI002E137B38|nr:hypothetical protein OG294_13885 [Kitasatospora sp. NBC_01302]